MTDRHPEVQEVIDRCPKSIIICNPGSLTTLHWAILTKNHSGLITLLTHGKDPKIADSEGQTPLHYAATSGDTCAVKILLEHGSDANAESRWGFTPLHLAIRRRHLNIVKLLLLNAPANVEDLKGNLANFMLLDLNNKTNLMSILQELHDHSADIISKERDRKTILDGAAGMDDSTMIEALYDLKVILKQEIETGPRRTLLRTLKRLHTHKLGSRSTT